MEEFNKFIRETPFEIQLPEIAVGKNLRIVGEPTLGVFPNNDQRTYSRSERLDFSLQLAGKVPIGIASVGGGVQNTITGEFIRQFPSQAAAVNVVANPPYNLKNLPITAARALKLQPGDYYRTKMRLAFAIAAGFEAQSGVVVGAVGAEYILAGDFQVEVYRKSGSRVFVRASSLQERVRGIRGVLGVDADLRLFQIDPIDSGVNNLLNVEIAEVDFVRHTRGRLFTIEFDYNLNNKESVAAFEHLVNPTKWELLDLRVLNPKGSVKKVERVLRSKIFPSEILSKKDQNKPAKDARVRRASRSNSVYESEESGFQVDIRLAKAEDSMTYLRQDFSYLTGHKSDVYNNYRIGTVNTVDGFVWGLGYDGRDIYSEANAIFETNNKKELVDFKELYFKVDRNDRRLDENELNDIQGIIHKMLPEEYHAKANVVPFLSQFLGKGTFVRIEMTLSGESLTEANGLSAQSVASIVERFVDTAIDREVEDQFEDYYGDLEFLKAKAKKDRGRAFTISDGVHFDLKRIDRALPVILSASRSPNQYEAKWNELVKLIRVPLFREMGSGIFTRLLRNAAGDSGFKRNIYFRVIARGREQAEANNEKIVEIGSYNNGKLALELIPLRNRIMNRDDFVLEYFLEQDVIQDNQ